MLFLPKSPLETSGELNRTELYFIKKRSSSDESTKSTVMMPLDKINLAECGLGVRYRQGGGCIEIDGNRSVDRSLRMEMGDGGADWRTDRYIDMKMDMYE